MNVTLDRAGRVVLPKPLREQMRLGPGDELEVVSEGEQITLRPVRPQVQLKKEHGVWVYQGGPVETSIPGLIDAQRAGRLSESIG
jgi:AbrB family looped-hinge helix DNA binding protein